MTASPVAASTFSAAANRSISSTWASEYSEARPTAFVCASDTLAMGVLHTLAHRGLRIGKDVAVVGFDDSQPAQVVPPGITSVRQPLEEVAVEVVRSRPPEEDEDEEAGREEAE